MKQKVGILNRKLDERLSAYLDGRLEAGERARLEAQLAADPTLQAEMESLRRTIALTRSLPPVAPSRNFLLPRNFEASARRAPAVTSRRAWVAPWLTAASAVAALLFVIVLVSNLRSAPGARAPAAEAPQAMMVVEVTKQVELEVMLPTEAPAPVEARDMEVEKATILTPSPAPTAAMLEAPLAAAPAPTFAEGFNAEAAASPPPVVEQTGEVIAQNAETGVAPTIAAAQEERQPAATPRLNGYAVEPPPTAPRRAVEVGLGMAALALALVAAWAWRARRRG